jgi:hypothetical protein
MAAKKKKVRKVRPLKGDGRDGADYREFIDAVLRGEVVATALIDTTVPDGVHTVRLPRFDAQGRRAEDIEVTYTRRRATAIEADVLEDE